ncbi:BRO family protein [Erythrobacter sp. sf7]|uniref:BRO family protein n=1 Tax=Erythrobacter fulvus TaxID=2987523 RepID=A0ABT5JQC2_9SPHN|nr:BRO family protein [Erythrobacter fulvus]MDC8754848.1 BRO family protein [Erythrobacter fulvus]
MDGAISTPSWRKNLRTIELDGEPWFHAADVCRCLGLDVRRGVYMYTNRLHEDEKQLVTRSQIAGSLGDSPWPHRGATVLSESGLYKLILRSDKDTARPFQDWVTKEVLPAIRKTGERIDLQTNEKSGRF